MIHRLQTGRGGRLDHTLCRAASVRCVDDKPVPSCQEMEQHLVLSTIGLLDDRRLYSQDKTSLCS